MHQLLPLSWDEIRRFPRCPADLYEALFSGGYPRIFDRNVSPSDWMRSYVASYIERDVRTIATVGDLTTFQRFVELCAGRTAQLLNYSALADDCGISQPTAKAWFSLLEASFVAFHLPPFNVNRRKRLVKMPKLYFYDTGGAGTSSSQYGSSVSTPAPPIRDPLDGAAAVCIRCHAWPSFGRSVPRKPSLDGGLREPSRTPCRRCESTVGSSIADRKIGQTARGRGRAEGSGRPGGVPWRVEADPDFLSPQNPGQSFVASCERADIRPVR